MFVSFKLVYEDFCPQPMIHEAISFGLNICRHPLPKDMTGNREPCGFFSTLFKPKSPNLGFSWDCIGLSMRVLEGLRVTSIQSDVKVGVSSWKTRSWSYLLSWWLVFCPQCMCRDDWWRGGWEGWIQIPGPLQLLLKNGAAVDTVGNPCRQDEVGSNTLLPPRVTLKPFHGTTRI